MRKLSYAVAASILALGLAGQAQAVNLGFNGGLAVQIATLAPVVVPGAGTAVVNGSGGPGQLNTMELPAGAFALSGFALAVTDPAVFPIAGIGIFGIPATPMGSNPVLTNGPGDFGITGMGAFAGAMPVNGIAKVCLYGTCGSTNNISNLSVPLNIVGVGGVASVMGAVNLTVVGAPWTTGTVAIGTITQMGGVSPISNTGAPSGNVSLVTPVFISTNIGAFSIVPAFAFLNLHFVPEPGTLVLLGSGVAGLVAFGRNRARK